MKRRKCRLQHTVARSFRFRPKRYKPASPDPSELSFLEKRWIPLLKQKLDTAMQRLRELKASQSHGQD